jgi:hypothetical protein
MRDFPTILITLFLAAPAMSGELFDILPRIGRRIGDAGVPNTACPILACLLFRHDQRTTATIVLYRAAAGWNGCCAKGGEAIVNVGSIKRAGLIGKFLLGNVYEICISDRACFLDPAGRSDKGCYDDF